jgi:hypothetical protein
MPRGLTTGKYIKQGRFTAIEKGSNAKKFRINAINRESAVVLSTGGSSDEDNDFSITPPSEVRRYDNSRVDDYINVNSDTDSTEGGQRKGTIYLFSLHEIKKLYTSPIRRYLLH